MARSRGLLVVQLDLPKEQEESWGRWHKEIHLPDRLALPGFLSARRFRRVDGVPREYIVGTEPQTLVLYELAHPAAASSSQYVQLREREAQRPPDSFDRLSPTLPKFARAVYKDVTPGQPEYSRPGTGYAFVVGHEVPRGKHKEFKVWYDTEHFASLMSVPGFVAGRRFVLADRSGWRGGEELPTYFTVYDIEDRSCIEGDAFFKATRSPWTAWVRSWYTRRICALYRRVYPEG